MKNFKSVFHPEQIARNFDFIRIEPTAQIINEICHRPSKISPITQKEIEKLNSRKFHLLIYILLL